MHYFFDEPANEKPTKDHLNTKIHVYPSDTLPDETKNSSWR